MKVEPSIGLSEDEAARRFAVHGPNELSSSDGRTMVRHIVGSVRQPMLALLIAAGLVNLALAEPLDGIVMFSFVIIVVAISVHQTWRTERALQALRDLSAPTSMVIRSGRRRAIPSRELVVGDRIIVREGDRVPADAVLVAGSDLTVDESALTGESVPVVKSCLDSERIMAGTLIGRGHAEASVDRTGSDTELGRIGQRVESIDVAKTPMQSQIDRVVNVVGLGAIGVAGAVAVGHGLLRHDWLEGSLIGIATAMSMIPEEFPVVFTVFLAVGAWRMSRQHVLVRRAPAIEALGAMTVACVDKTGTLTLNHMTPVELVVNGTVWRPDSDPLPERFHELVDIARFACPIDAFDPIDRACRSLAERLPPDRRGAPTRARLVTEYPLTSQFFAVSFAWALDDHVLVATKGAPETVARMCHLDEHEQSRLSEQVDQAAARGLRVLAVATAITTARDLPEKHADLELRLCGLVCLKDPLRPGVTDAVTRIAKAGIRTIMMTGDHPTTARAIAQEVGLDTEPGLVSGDDIDGMDDAAFAKIATDVNVFARTTPEHKFRLVRALQNTGHIVGMTGDGVNDAPALKAADIGIAMGGRGTDVAREASSIVIVDDSFPSLVAGIERGRGIYSNIRKAFAYVISMHVPIIGLTTVQIFARDWPVVLLPLQIALLELIIDPACSIVFEAESNDSAVMSEPPRSPRNPLLDRHAILIALSQGLALLVFSALLYFWAIATDRPDSTVRTLVFVSLVIGNLGLIFTNRSWRLSVVDAFRSRRNATLPWLVAAVLTALTVMLTVPVVRDSLGFGPVRAYEAVIAVTVGLMGSSWFEVYKLMHRTVR